MNRYKKCSDMDDQTFYHILPKDLEFYKKLIELNDLFYRDDPPPPPKLIPITNIDLYLYY
jgi:hypothetical protein